MPAPGFDSLSYTSPRMTTEPRTDWSRTPWSGVRELLAGGLLAIAFVWPFLDIGPRGRTLIVLTQEHGVDAGDLLAVIPFVLALALLFWRRP